MRRLFSLILALGFVLSVRGEQAGINASSSFPRTGTVRVPVLLCAYPDQPFSIENPREAFSAMLNETGYSENGATGSAHEYYLISSDGWLDLRFDVYGPYTVSHNMEYYGGNTGSSHSKNAQELVKEMINLAGNDGVDFSLYDADNNGVVDAVPVIFAGHNEAEGGDEKTLWPHQSYISMGPVWSGKSFSSYLVTSELREATGTRMAGIGTFCHEFGHVLGLPDLYNTTAEQKPYTIGSWDIMCNGSYNNNGRTPPLLSAFERFMMGWHLPTQIYESGIYSLPPLETADTSFLVAASIHNLSQFSPAPAEYFIIENRQRTGWDGRHADCLPGVGLLIFHITFSERNWNNNTFNNALPLGVGIEEAYNRNPTSAAPNDTYPGTMNVTTFTPVLNNGDSLTLYRLHNILQRNSGIVSFAFGNTTDATFTFSPAELDTFVTTFDGTIQQYTPQTLTVTGSGIAASTVTMAFANSFYALSDGEWMKPGAVFTDSVNADGTYRRTLSLRFEPRRQSCIPTSSSFRIFTGDSTTFAAMSVLGISPRPDYLTPPDSLTASEIQSDNFRISWKQSPDAELYFVQAHAHDPNTGTYRLFTEREVVAPADHTYLNGLDANTEYQVTVTAVEQKSCFEHRAVSQAIHVSTTIDPDATKALPVVQYDDGTCILLLPEDAAEGMTVYIFSTDGQLLSTLDITPGLREVVLPTHGLTPGQLYLLQYTTTGRLSRHARFAKFILR